MTHRGLKFALKRVGISFPESVRSRWENARPSLTMPTDPYVIGYLAGLFDGEGCISRGAKTRWQLTIANTSKELVDWLRSLGGTYSTVPANRYGANRKAQHRWYLGRRADMAIFLKTIIPYMRISEKKAQSIEAVQEIEFWLNAFKRQ